MKQQPVLFIVFAAILTLTACSGKAKRAQAYYDTNLKTVQVVIDSSLEYGDGIQTHNKTQALRIHQNYTALVNKAIDAVEGQKSFEGDTTLQHYSMEMLLFYKKSLEKGFSPLLNSVKGDAFTSDEAQTADSLYGEFTMTEAKYWDRFNWAEKKFAKENGIDKLEKKD